MEYIRLLHKRHYDHHRGRFQTLVFKNTSRPRGGPGISVISVQCILDAGRTLCQHIREYYARVADEPPIFWRFSPHILPSGYRLEPQESDTGDVCHYNIVGLSDKQAEDYFRERAADLPSFRICSNHADRPLAERDLQ